MEFLEMVNVQFAFPVVGVVLCAVLVFAFGFKSSVQPPSFDSFYDDEEEDLRNKKKSKQKKSKILDNTHSSPNKRSVVKSTSSPTSKQVVSDKSDQQASKNKQKIAKAVLLPSAPSAAVPKNIKPEEDVVGQWTTVSLKKNKKNDDKKEAIIPIATGQPAAVAVAATIIQRTDVVKSFYPTQKAEQVTVIPASSSNASPASSVSVVASSAAAAKVVNAAGRLGSPDKSVSKPAVVVKSSPVRSSPAKVVLAAPAVTLAAQGTVLSSQPASASPLAFDELGESEWQEKTIKKKKKSKKEN